MSAWRPVASATATATTTTTTTTTTTAEPGPDYGGYGDGSGSGSYYGDGSGSGTSGSHVPCAACTEDPHMACEAGPCAQCHECHGAVDELLQECDLICDATEYQHCVEHADSILFDCDFTCEECHVCHNNAESGAGGPCEQQFSSLDECLVPAYDCMNSAQGHPACGAAEECFMAAWAPCTDVPANATECEAASERCHTEHGWECEQAHRSCDMLYFPCEQHYMDVLLCEGDGCMAYEGTIEGPCMAAEMCFIESFKQAASCWSNATSYDEARECDKAFGSCDGKGCECANCYVEQEGGARHDCSGKNETGPDAEEPRPKLLRRKAEGGMSRVRSFARWSARGLHGVAAGKRPTPTQLKQRAMSRRASVRKTKPSAAWFASSAKVVKQAAKQYPAGNATNATDPHMRCEEGPCLQCNECHESIETKYWSCEEECDHDAYWQCIDEVDRMWQDCDFKCEECSECHYQAEEEMRAVNDPCHEGCSACDSCLEPVWQCHDSAWQSENCTAANQCYDKVWNEVCSSAQTDDDWQKCDAAYRECDVQGFACHKEYLHCDMQGFECQDQCTSCNQCHGGDGCQGSPPCMDADMCYLHAWMITTQCQLHANSWDEAEPCYESYNACQVEACECENCYAAEYGWEPMPCHGDEDHCGAKLIRARGGAKARRGRGYQAWKLRRRHGPVSKREVAKRFADGKLRRKSQ